MEKFTVLIREYSWVISHGSQPRVCTFSNLLPEPHLFRHLGKVKVHCVTVVGVMSFPLRRFANDPPPPEV